MAETMKNSQIRLPKFTASPTLSQPDPGCGEAYLEPAITLRAPKEPRLTHLASSLFYHDLGPDWGIEDNRLSGAPFHHLPEAQHRYRVSGKLVREHGPGKGA